MNALDWIASVREHVERDPGLAVYVVRDLPATERAELTDLAWAYCQYRATRGEVTALLDGLEAFIKEEQCNDSITESVV